MFNKQTGLASTTERIEFRLAQAAGSATGASFDSQTGIMILVADVAFNSSVGGSPLSVRAHHAQFDRGSRLLYLLPDVTDYADSHSLQTRRPSPSAPTDRLTGWKPKATWFSPAVTANRSIPARRMWTWAPRANRSKRFWMAGYSTWPTIQLACCMGRPLPELSCSVRNRPSSTAQLRDAVFRGRRGEAPAGFRVRRARSKQNPLPSRPPVKSEPPRSTSTLPLAPTAAPWPSTILAVGGAQQRPHHLCQNAARGHNRPTGDQLFATLLDGEVLSSLRGTGHTGLTDVSPSGTKQTSTGDNLLLTFAPRIFLSH